jgi:5-methylthioribose kinase
MESDRKTSIRTAQATSPKNQPKTFVFDLVALGHDSGQMTVVIDQHFPKDVAEIVARTFLHRRLLALAQQAEYGTLSDEELRAAWSRCKPAHYPK